MASLNCVFWQQFPPVKIISKEQKNNFKQFHRTQFPISIDSNSTFCHIHSTHICATRLLTIYVYTLDYMSCLIVLSQNEMFRQNWFAFLEQKKKKSGNKITSCSISALSSPCILEVFACVLEIFKQRELSKHAYVQTDELAHRLDTLGSSGHESGHTK